MVGGGGKQYRGGPNVGADDVRVTQAEGVGDAEDEMPHCLRVHQRLAVVRSAEAGGIDGDQVRGGREVRPRRLESVYAFRPRAHQDRVGTVLAAFGVADRQSINRDCLRVNQGAHGHSLLEANSWPDCQSWTRRSAGPRTLNKKPAW